MTINKLLPPSFFQNNRKKLAALMPANSIAIIFSNEEHYRNGDQTYPFHQDSNFFYLSGIQQEKSILVVFPDCKYPEYRELLFIRDNDYLTDLWEGVKLKADEASEISGIKTVRSFSEFSKLIDVITFNCETIFLDNRLFDDSCRVVSNEINNVFVKNRCPLHKFGRLAPIMQVLRLKKSPEELLITREACKLTGKAFDRILHFVKPGVWEYQIEAEMTHEFLMNGQREHAFAPICASGKNACSLHYDVNRSQCQDGDLLLMDFGVNVAQYASDCTRTIPINGKFTKRQRDMYEAVLRVYKHSFNMMRKGISLLQINRMLQPIWEEEHVNLGLYSVQDLKRQDPKSPLFKKYYPHTVSHYIGLDVHDVGDREEVLEGGEIVSCEPGLYVPEEGIGIRLENTVMITQAEAMNMMSDIPIEAEEIEILMQKYREEAK